MLIRFAVSPFTSNTFSKLGNSLLTSLPIPKISPLAPSPKFTELEAYPFKSFRYVSTPVICLEQPLSKYQSSLDDALRDVCAINPLFSVFGCHTFLTDSSLGAVFGCCQCLGYPYSLKQKGLMCPFIPQ
ncbi:gag-protease polyprotein [Trifolium repens]|nr:gag-protease polyprotein [Trifolium repens]